MQKNSSSNLPIFEAYDKSINIQWHSVGIHVTYPVAEILILTYIINLHCKIISLSQKTDKNMQLIGILPLTS